MHYHPHSDNNRPLRHYIVHVALLLPHLLNHPHPRPFSWPYECAGHIRTTCAADKFYFFTPSPRNSPLAQGGITLNRSTRHDMHTTFISKTTPATRPPPTHHQGFVKFRISWEPKGESSVVGFTFRKCVCQTR